jgi:hypothetical protein
MSPRLVVCHLLWFIYIYSVNLNDFVNFDLSAFGEVLLKLRIFCNRKVTLRKE